MDRPNINRKWKELPKTPKGDGENKFSVLTYNILTDVHIDEKLYFYVNDDKYDQSDRYVDILDEIKHVDPDIFCLQEIKKTVFDSGFQKDFNKLGYSGHFVKDLADTDGLAVLYKNGVFDEIAYNSYSVRNLLLEAIKDAGVTKEDIEKYMAHFPKARGFQVLKLRHKASGKDVIIGNTHIHWTKYYFPGIQCLQTALNVRAMEKLNDNCAMVYAGDFNATPDFVAYRMIEVGASGVSLEDRKLPSFDFYKTDRTKGASREMVGERVPSDQFKNFLDEALTISVNTTQVDISTMQLALHLWPKDLKFDSSHKTIMGEEPPVTNSNIEHVWDNIHVNTLDYIWYDPNKLEATGTLQGPEVSDVLKYGSIPSPGFPSDHISVMSKFRIL